MIDKNIDFYSFGFREVFRIMIPGLWIIIIFSNKISKPIWDFLSKFDINYPQNIDTFLLLSVTWIIGFIWFSIQLSKKLKCYKAYVLQLRNFMMELRDLKNEVELIDKPVYQYYLANVLSPASRVRIHYFASLYYMLMDISIITFLVIILNLIILIINLIFWGNFFTYSINETIIFVILGMVGLLVYFSAHKFLKDVMLFSLYCLQINKVELKKLINIAQETNHLQKMFK
jgi:hypothetical protein